ncbi:MAG: presenilin family intramembrane aspartyl protease [Patescibacteria group bacterium]
MKIHKGLLLNQSFLFLATLAIAMAVAGNSSALLGQSAWVEPLEVSWTSGVSLIVFFLLFSFLLARFRFLSGWILRFFLSVLIFSGTQFALLPWLPPATTLLITLVVTVAFWLWRIVAIHNLSLVLAIGGVAGLVGMSISPTIAIFILSVFAIYDIIAVYRTHHMVALAQNMIASGVIVGFLIPPQPMDFTTPTETALRTRSHMLLGSGDSGLPALLVASTLFYGSLAQAIIVAVSVLAGAALMHVIFLNQRERAPMAALPPIATAAIVGYLISLFIV